MTGTAAQLSDHHREWLRLLYCEGLDPAAIASRFGVAPKDIFAVKLSPAGLAYANSLIVDRRGLLNIRAAELLLSHLNDSNAKNIPVDTLVKIYNATAPKTPPVMFQISADMLRQEAEKVADRYGLQGEFRQNMIDFVVKQKQKAQEENQAASANG